MPTPDQDLYDLITAVDGVGGVEIDLREDGRPHVRVWLDGTVPAPEVSEKVRAAVDTAPDSPAVGQAPSRDTLGRELPETLQTTPAESLALIAVEETAGGVSVRAADSGGGLAFSPVADPRSINQAIVNAVARLRQERPLPRLGGVEIRDVSGQAVLTVVLVFADDTRAVGAALVKGGMPFTLGKAAWEALGSPRMA